MVDYKSVLIQVTQHDIDWGCRSDDENCPVARAVQRVLSPAWSACIPGRCWQARPRSSDSAGNPLPPPLLEGSLPIKVRQWIANFDRYPTMAKPFTFLLVMPANILGTYTEAPSVEWKL